MHLEEQQMINAMKAVASLENAARKLRDDDCDDMGVEKPSRTTRTPTIHKIVPLYGKGLTKAQVAEKIGASHGTVSAAIKRAGIIWR